MENMQPEKRHKNKRKILILSAFLSLLVVAAVSIPLAHRHSRGGSASTSAVVRSTCAATLYPDLCLSTLAAAAPAAAVKTSRDVLITALNYTVSTVENNLLTVKKLQFQRLLLTPRERGALSDCVEMISDTLDEVRATSAELGEFGFKNYSLAAHKENLLTLLSAGQTNQDSCLDGFSHGGADRKVRAALIAGQKHVFRLVSNAMAVINSLSTAEEEEAAIEARPEERRLAEEWPEWLSAGDRRLLQSSAVRADVTVAADGSGNHRTVSAAVAAAPEGRSASRRYVIRIKAGVYRESVEIPKKKTNLMFVGDGRMNTIITASKNVVDGSTTFNSATVG